MRGVVAASARVRGSAPRDRVRFVWATGFSPAVAPGVPAPAGSLGVTIDGATGWVKLGALDTGWVELSQGSLFDLLASPATLTDLADFAVNAAGGLADFGGDIGAGARGMCLLETWAPAEGNAQSHNFTLASGSHDAVEIEISNAGYPGAGAADWLLLGSDSAVGRSGVMFASYGGSWLITGVEFAGVAGYLPHSDTIQSSTLIRLWLSAGGRWHWVCSGFASESDGNPCAIWSGGGSMAGGWTYLQVKSNSPDGFQAGVATVALRARRAP